MSRVMTWRPGDTPYPGYTFEDGNGAPIAAVAIDQFIVEFTTTSGVELAKFSKTELADHTLAIATSEVVEAGGDPVDVFRFPISHEVTELWPSSGKVNMMVKVRLTSAVFAEGYRKVFDEVVAILKPGNTTAI